MLVFPLAAAFFAQEPAGGGRSKTALDKDNRGVGPIVNWVARKVLESCGAP